MIRIGVPLSLSGRYARFGRQAALGLRAWQACDGGAELRIEDDRSDPGEVVASLRGLLRGCDLVLGPYSTRLARAAGDAVAEAGGLLWNHGGAGDDVQHAHPGHVVSVLTPAGRYAEPFVRHVGAGPLVVAQGRGSFGRQVAAGAGALAAHAGIPIATQPPPGRWSLLCAGSFDEDVAAVHAARRLASPPATICAVAAGVHEFGERVADADGIYGVAQWSAGDAATPAVGPAEPVFHAAWSRLAAGPPDYPAVQAAAAAALAAHCAGLAGSTERAALWAAVTALDTTTLFGAFRVDPLTGAQTGHRTVLVRWAAGALRRTR